MTRASYRSVGAICFICVQTFPMSRIITGMNQGPPTIFTMK